VALGAEGFVVDVAADGEEALAMFEALEPEIVLLDVMLPRLSGIDVCRRIRSIADTPVIMVSARREEIDTVVGLEVGADDYVAKPYRVRELVARMRTVMRRSRTRPVNSFNGTAELQVADVALDRDRHEVTIGGKLERLPLKEFEVLALLMENAGFVVSRQTLIDRVIVDGSGRASDSAGENLRGMQTGKVQQYAAILFAAATILAGVFMLILSL